MKKLISIILIFALLLPNAVYADDKQILSKKLSSIWLSPTENADVLENIRIACDADIEEYINLYLITPGYYRKKVGISENDEEMMKQIREGYSVKEDSILKAYYMKNNAYSKMYADNSSFRYLITEDYNWVMKLRTNYQRYKANGQAQPTNNPIITTFGAQYMTDEGFSALKDTEKIYEVLNGIDISTIKDIKFLSLNANTCSCLYFDCGDEEYLIRIYMGQYSDKDNYQIKYDWAENVELYKLYTAKEFLNIVSEDMNQLNTEKPTFEAEALSLQQDGLLHGNENGLDLLKPLTRIEAATMLLRALGESTESNVATQTFSDVPTSHWGYGAAENAYNLGLIKGIGNNLFAPDEAVTGTQFATMILRAGEYGEFNWEEALDILINENIISAENASTMDFFTRGDMAKIIYEARKKNLFK